MKHFFLLNRHNKCTFLYILYNRAQYHKKLCLRLSKPYEISVIAILPANVVYIKRFLVQKLFVANRANSSDI